jgi:hypothetical protein
LRNERHLYPMQEEAKHNMQAVSKLTDQWIELFRAGDHGAKGSFTEADLDQIVANYQPQGVHEAPVTIGHIEGNAPAYGWMGSLKRAGAVLLGKMSTAQPEFEEMVEKELFKKRSVGLVKDSYGQKGWGLHHVAFLGAKPPEIKGLADCRFDGSSAQIVEVEFQESSMAGEVTATSDGIIARLDAWFNERFGPKTVQLPAQPSTKTFSEDDVKRIAAEAATTAAAEAVKPLQDTIDEQKKTFSERETKAATAETSARADAAIARVKASGRWIPAFDKMGLAHVFGELAKSTETVEFGEGDAKQKLTALETLTVFMEKMQKIVPAGADIYAGQVAKQASGVVRFNEVGSKADPNSVTLANLSETRAQEKKITYSEAMSQVLAENPHLAIPGGVAAGAV